MISLGGVMSIAAGRSRVIDADLPQALTLSVMTFSATSDSDWEVYLDKDVSALDRPVQPTLTTSNALGQLPSSTKVYVRVTVVDSLGLESPPSLGNKLITTNSATQTNRVSASWAAVTGATAYRVYVGSRPGMEALYSEVTTNSATIDFLPGDMAGAIPTMADILLSPAKGESSAIEPSSPLTIARRIIIYVNAQVAATAFISCLAG